MAIEFARNHQDAIAIHCIRMGEELPAALDSAAHTWAKSVDFTGAAGQVCLVPKPNGDVALVLAGLGDKVTRKRKRFVFGAIRNKLPVGTYEIANADAVGDLTEACLGWLLAGYRFSRYAKAPESKAELIAPIGVDAPRLELIAQSECLTRDLINIPANDMGPDALEAAACKIADEFGATAKVTSGDALLSENFPMIHTVGRAASQAPRLIELNWGSTGPRVTLVGKGVCFDTGGLNIKPGGSMGLMKKDMGGAANVLGLSRMIMGSGMNVQLRVLIPAVENAIAGDAFRPGDILNSRKGLTVEINNTDAEGRLVLGDALALADEDAPELIISMATLTGAARVAVGPDLAPFYATDNNDAAELEMSAASNHDPVWQMPFWDPYEEMIEPGIADLDNAPKGGFAGSITAALFLRRFVTETPRYMHFDIYGWNPSASPGRSKGGAAQGIRALFDALPRMLDL